MEYKEYINPLENDYDLRNQQEEEPVEQVAGKNIISMMFTDLYFELGAPELTELELFGIDEKDFENPTMETIEKLNNYGANTSKKR